MITCKECGSNDVEIAGWMNPNTGEFQMDLALGAFEFGAGYWCANCKKSVNELEEKKEEA